MLVLFALKEYYEEDNHIQLIKIMFLVHSSPWISPIKLKFTHVQKLTNIDTHKRSSTYCFDQHNNPADKMSTLRYSQQYISFTKQQLYSN